MNTGVLTIEQARAPGDIRDVRELLREYTQWSFATTEGSSDAPTFEGFEDELKTLPGIYAPPTGALLLARYDGEAAGCVALKGHDGGVSELKRMYVRPTFRGKKIGEALVSALIAEARRLGYRHLRLDSHATMTAAHALYERAGFRRVAAPRDFPDELVPIVVFMEMDLAPQS